MLKKAVENNKIKSELQSKSSIISSESAKVRLKLKNSEETIENINSTNKFFYVRTVNNNYGWIHNDCGISINYNEEEEWLTIHKNIKI